MKYIPAIFFLLATFGEGSCGKHFDPSPDGFMPAKVLSREGDLITVESTGKAVVKNGDYEDAYQLAYYRAGNSALLGASKIDIDTITHAQDQTIFLSLMREVQKGEIVDREVQSIDWDKSKGEVSIKSVFKIRSTTTSQFNPAQILIFDLTTNNPPKTKSGQFYIGERKSSSLLLLDQKHINLLLSRIESVNPSDFWTIKSVTLTDKIERKVFEVAFSYDDSGMKYRKSLFQMIEKINQYRMPKEYYEFKEKSFPLSTEWNMVYVDRSNVTYFFKGGREFSPLNFDNVSEFNKTRPEIQIIPNNISCHLRNLVYLNLQFLDATGKELGVYSRSVTGSGYMKEYNENLPFYQKVTKSYGFFGRSSILDPKIDTIPGYYVRVNPDYPKEFKVSVLVSDMSAKDRMSIHTINASFSDEQITRSYEIIEKIFGKK